ncbi:hypothetical protein OAI96_01560 [Pelagibacteraceae bacterium]|nr:hypothetical protein [Pelagibacteraceae bacterium]
MEKINEINLVDIIIFVKTNFIKIILTTIILASIPCLYTTRAYFDKSASLVFKFQTSPFANLDMRVVNNTINQFYQNTLLDQMRQKLEFFHTEYLTGSNEIFNLNTNNNQNILYLDPYFFSDALKKSDYIGDNNFSYKIKKDDLKEFQYTLIFTKYIEDKTVLDIKKIESKLTTEINNQIVKAINDIVIDAKSKYELQKKEILENINRSNMLISNSYIFNLRNEITQLEERLKIVESVDEDFVLRSDIDLNFAVGDENELLFSVFLGSDALKKQIEINTNKLNKSSEYLPQIYFNKQLIELVKSDAFLNQIGVTESKFVSRILDFFTAYESNLSISSFSYALTLVYLLLILFVSFILSIIFYISIASLRLKK